MVHEEDKQDQDHGYPDICSKPRVWKVNKPQDPEYKVIKILRWIGILVSFLLGLIIIPLMAGVLALFFIIPRIIIQVRSKVSITAKANPSLNCTT